MYVLRSTSGIFFLSYHFSPTFSFFLFSGRANKSGPLSPFSSQYFRPPPSHLITHEIFFLFSRVQHDSAERTRKKRRRRRRRRRKRRRRKLLQEELWNGMKRGEKTSFWQMSEHVPTAHLQKKNKRKIKKIFSDVSVLLRVQWNGYFIKKNCSQQ